MGGRGSDPLVEQVRAATDIVAVVSSYVELHKAGKRWKGLCPFHAEKTASFFVNRENQTFYCFGCQQGGDVFSFLMEQEKLSFPEVLRSLADKAGIVMPTRRHSGEAGVDDRLAEAMEVAADFYRERLASAEGTAARDYLAARAIGPEEIERFGIGWAPASWDALLRKASRLLPERVLVKAGLVVEGERGLYDRLRERVAVQIRSAWRRTARERGRLLGPGEPKYLNSPETPLYRKGTVLFGLKEAREGIRREKNVLVVEGYFDVIALSRAGVDWTVGTCGTALSAEQATLLRRYSERWTLLFDGDSAGRDAVLRAFDAAVGVHPSVRVAICPDGLDPDDWVRRDGAEKLREGLRHARSPLQYLEEWARVERLSPEATLARVAGLLGRLTDPMVRDLWIQEAAGRFRIREQTLLATVGGASTARRSRSIPTARSSEKRLGLRDRQIVAAAVRRPASAVALHEASQDVPGVSVRCRELLEWIAARYVEGVTEPARLLSRVADEGEEMVQDLAFLHEETGSMEEVPPDLLHRLRGWGLRQRMRDLTDRIRQAEEKGEAIDALLAEKQDLAMRLRDIEALEELRD